MTHFFFKHKRRIAFLLVIGIVNSIVSPTAALALTSGPAQPEAASFTPVETNDMVNLFTGDFNYNIPLLDVGGYPVNIGYSGGSFMDQEASWVGLGWNINPGAINRNMRGLPDDYKGDLVKKEMNIKANETYGVSLSVGGEIFGFDGVGVNYGFGVTYNNYSGYGITQSLGLSVQPIDGFPGTIGLGLCSGSDGLTVSPQLNLSAMVSRSQETTGDVSVGISMNSRTGLKSLTLDACFTGRGGKRGVRGFGKITTYDFGMPTYVPELSMSMRNESYLYSFKLGGTALGFDLTGDVTGNYSKQSLALNSLEVPAYGYMYQEEGQDLEEVLLDFNREKDASFTENSVCLPLTNNTCDLYNVSGQGIGGSYRMFRGDIGHVFDSKVTTESKDQSGSVEISTGSTVQYGGNIYKTNTHQYSGKWKDDNMMVDRFRFQKKKIGNVYEPAYFKEAGEMTAEDDDLLASVFGNTPVRFEYECAGYASFTVPRLAIAEGVTYTAPEKNQRAKRAKRNQYMSYVTKMDYQAGGLDRSLYSKIPGAVPLHHIAEMTTTRTDGSRYVYGLPVFNMKQVEKSFNVSGNSVTNNIVAITGNEDTPQNSKGIDHFYTSTELPPYAYSYLLTAVLSPDYVDITGNGPTNDDLGTYTKFEYENPYDYKWRTPFVAGADYREGLKTDNQDDKGSYVYGEKQITYLKKIVTKNYVAVFNLQSRKDGYGVSGMAGGSLGAAQKLLESIQLFSGPDYNANSSNLANATVIKQVNFVYDYSLCQNGTGVPNNNGAGPTSPYETANQGGKLTLKKIYFTYGRSKKAHLSPYEFSYNTTALDAGHSPITPGYDPRCNDRWGTFKPENSSGMPNNEYPYVEQDKVTADSYAGLWNLRQIVLPSGGVIDVSLESDDYAYVQDKRAAQMFLVTGSDHTVPSSPYGFSVPTNNDLYDSGNNYTVFFFKLQEPINYGFPGNIGAAKQIFDAEYLSEIDNLYFRFMTNVNGTLSSPGYEYVSGFTKITASGVVNSTGAPANHADYGWIQIESVNRGDKGGTFANQENPISKATWQFGRMHTPKAVVTISGQPSPPSASIKDFLMALANADLSKNTYEFFRGIYGVMKSPPKQYGKKFQIGKSWLRLNSPKRARLGGGNRVKRITISDEWSSMLSATTTNAGKTFQYGQTYQYTTDMEGVAYPISSGVAAYEPAFGADENACRQPIYNERTDKKQELLLAPDNDLYQEGPYGESFFPSPVVGYSKVTVKNLDRMDVTKNATGRTEHEFYTARDFPVIVQAPTDLYIRRVKPNALQKILQIDYTDNITASQGYCIEVNDMHGKPHGATVYDASSNKISSVRYDYRVSEGRLNNDVPTLSKNGDIRTKNVGVDLDMVADFREQKSSSETKGLQVNNYFMIIGAFPLFIPPILPSSKKESIRFRSAGITKLIHHYGILEKTVAEDMGSIVETSNLLWDAETGKVLLTSVNTEFKDMIYQFSYPGYFAYSGMDASYKNTGMEFDMATIAVSTSPGANYGKVSPAYKPYLEPGDEFIVINKFTKVPIAMGTSNTQDSKCWVSKKGNDYYLVDKTGGIIYANGNVSGTNYILKLVRSGKRNLQDLSAGSLTTLDAPVDLSIPVSKWPVMDVTKNVLNAGAVEFGSTWRTVCECGVATPGSNANEYLNGTAGIYRPKKSYTYLTLRRQTDQNGNTNIRRDGVFEKFDPFWTPNSGQDWLKPGYLDQPNSRWTWASEITEFNPYGAELENKDALNRYSSAVYGYNHSLPVAVGSNARYRQLAFDGFEDYGFGCSGSTGHFSFKSSTQTPMTYLSGNTDYQKFAHSGRKSIKVASGQSPVIVTKDLKPCQ